MATKIVSKFKKGDRVVVVNKESWCDGCHGTVKGVWRLEGVGLLVKTPYYLVHLDDSPSPVVQESFIYETELEGEANEKA